MKAKVAQAMWQVRYFVAADMQAKVARTMGHELCIFCQWAIKPGETHEFCQDQLATNRQVEDEIAAAWEEYYQQQADEEVETYENDYEETYTEVNLGGDPGGYCIYE